jgi:hypothetical protein
LHLAWLFYLRLPYKKLRRIKPVQNKKESAVESGFLNQLVTMRIVKRENANTRGERSFSC